MSSPVEALRAEAGIPSITTQIRRNCVHIREKALRLPANHPRHTAFTAPAPRRLPKCKDARSTAEAATSRIPDLRHERIQLGYFEVPPWNAGLGKVEIFAQLEGISGKTDDKCLIKSRAIDRAKYLAADYNIYTDGSAAEGVTQGGAGVVITTGDPVSPKVITTPVLVGFL